MVFSGSYLVYPGLEWTSRGYRDIHTHAEDIDNFLNHQELEKAATAIYNRYGNYSIETQQNLLRIVQKIVELNAGSSFPEHKIYPLEKARCLGCDMYIIAINQRDDRG